MIVLTEASHLIGEQKKGNEVTIPKGTPQFRQDDIGPGVAEKGQFHISMTGTLKGIYTLIDETVIAKVGVPMKWQET